MQLNKLEKHHMIILVTLLLLKTPYLTLDPHFNIEDP